MSKLKTDSKFSRMQKDFLCKRRTELEKKIAFHNNGFECSALRELRDYGKENHIMMSVDKKQLLEFDTRRNNLGKSVDEIKFSKITSPLSNSLLQLRVSSIISTEEISKLRTSLMDDEAKKVRASLKSSARDNQ